MQFYFKKVSLRLMFILGIKLWLIIEGFYNDFNNLIIEVNEYFVVDFVQVFYVNL